MESMKIRGQDIITGVKDTGNNFIAGNHDTVNNVSPVPFTPAINTKLKISRRFFAKILNGSNGILAQGKLIHEKN
jgi:hypothetical protein